MKEVILNSLKDIEKKHNVKILWAVESGSRAWGFPSKDSDYDVRFIYVHKPDYYLTIDPVGVGSKKDYIELPINNLLDINGWDLTKTLRLLRKSNSALKEWLRSDIVYLQQFDTIDKIKELDNTLLSPHSWLYHYINTAKNNFREYLQGENVKIKKYFYVLRPVLAGRWIEEYNEFPPLNFEKLLAEVVPEGELKNQITTLFERKIRGDELDLEPRIDVINTFLNTEIDRLEKYAKTVRVDIPDPTKQLDELFRDTLNQVWVTQNL